MVAFNISKNYEKINLNSIINILNQHKLNYQRSTIILSFLFHSNIFNKYYDWVDKNSYWLQILTQIKLNRLKEFLQNTWNIFLELYTIRQNSNTRIQIIPIQWIIWIQKSDFSFPHFRNFSFVNLLILWIDYTKKKYFILFAKKN